MGRCFQQFVESKGLKLGFFFTIFLLGLNAFGGLECSGMLSDSPAVRARNEINKLESVDISLVIKEKRLSKPGSLVVLNEGAISRIQRELIRKHLEIEEGTALVADVYEKALKSFTKRFHNLLSFSVLDSEVRAQHSTPFYDQKVLIDFRILEFDLLFLSPFKDLSKVALDNSDRSMDSIRYYYYSIIQKEPYVEALRPFIEAIKKLSDAGVDVNERSKQFINKLIKNFIALGSTPDHLVFVSKASIEFKETNK